MRLSRERYLLYSKICNKLYSHLYMHTFASVFLVEVPLCFSASCPTPRGIAAHTKRSTRSNPIVCPMSLFCKLLAREKLYEKKYVLMLFSTCCRPSSAQMARQAQQEIVLSYLRGRIALVESSVAPPVRKTTAATVKCQLATAYTLVVAHSWPLACPSNSR